MHVGPENPGSARSMPLKPAPGMVSEASGFTRRYAESSFSLRDEPTVTITGIKLLAQAMVIVGAIYWLFYAVLLVPLPGPFWAN